jgi:hypothetical protein
MEMLLLIPIQLSSPVKRKADKLTVFGIKKAFLTESAKVECILLKEILLNPIFLNMVNLDLETCPQFNF